MTLQTVFFTVGIVALIAGISVGAFAAFTYVKLEIRAVRDELSGAARARSADQKTKKPAGSTSKMKAFSQISWKGKIHANGEATTDSFSGKTNKSGSLGVQPALPVMAEGARPISNQAVSSDFATGEEPTSLHILSFEGNGDDEPTGVARDVIWSSEDFRIVRKTIVLGSKDVLAD